MKHCQLGRVCLSVSLLLGFVFFSSVPVYSERAYWQAEPSAEQPPEKNATGLPGLEKLSPDLRHLVQEASAPISILPAAEGNVEPIMVTALLTPGTDVERYFIRMARSRIVSGIQWVTGEIQASGLAKLASVRGVTGIISTSTYQTVEAPGLDELRRKYPRPTVEEARQYLELGAMPALEQPLELNEHQQRFIPDAQGQALSPASAAGILDVHDVHSAHAQGYDGEGVVVAVVDTGVDFAHPDLNGTQKEIANGPYAGWPFAYDTYSGALYALDPENTLGPDTVLDLLGSTQYVHTLPVDSPACDGYWCSGELALGMDDDRPVKLSFTWPDTSKSRQYYYSLHPDYVLPMSANRMGMDYPTVWMSQSPVVVSDEAQAGVYDTVYLDLNYNTRLGDPDEKMTRDDPVAGVDLYGDGIWDLSGGMLAWISDGVHQPPGVEVLYPHVSEYPVPGSGRLLAFINDINGHGTNCASEIAGQGQITDPYGVGPINPLYAGGEQVGGVGGPVIQSVAPDSKIAAFENGFALPFDSWTLAVLGFDGIANSGDEAHIISNSWGDSLTIEDGWDELSRFAHQLSNHEAQTITFLVATGNGGHGYGTSTSPSGGSIIDVGASTAYGSLLAFENVRPEQFVYGEVPPWSNRGPGMLGDVAPDISAVGAWGPGANPLNIYYGNGQAAYDVFGGTSMSTPVAAGGMALIYEAFEEEHGRWPSWQEARALLLGTAQNLGYDVFTQGAGNFQSGRAIAAAADDAPLIYPVQWQAGDYRDEDYDYFPALLAAGETDSEIFTITNPAAQPLTVTAQGSTYQQVHDEIFSYSFVTPEPSSLNGLPIYLEDLSTLIADHQPDYIRAQVIQPYLTFDVDRDYYVDSAWGVYFYDWSDRNGNQRLWADDNRNGMVDQEELDVDPDTGLYEHNRFTYGYPMSTYVEASLGKLGLEQGTREGHRVFLGLKCSFCGHSTTLQVRLTFYQQVPWAWLHTSAESGVTISQPAGSFSAQLTVPDGTPPGSYAGSIRVEANGVETLVPVTVIVPMEQPTFASGGPPGTDGLYDNSHLLGGYNWNWRYEAGDWRFFYYDVDLPEGSTGAGRAMIVDTRWNSPATDIDSWIFGPDVEDPYAQAAPELFGAQGLRQIGGSQDSLISGGKFRWQTATGAPRELVSAPVQDGLGVIALHQVLSGGQQFAEAFTGQLYQISSNPQAIEIIATSDGGEKPYLSGRQQVSIASSGDIEDGLVMQVYGMNVVEKLENQVITQQSNDLCTSTWVYAPDGKGLEINRGGVLEITTSSDVSNMDIDLYLLKDNGDGKLNCARDRVHAYSVSAYSDESIKIYYPQDGTYWVIVQGREVPSGPHTFDIQIRALQGGGLSLRNAPVGPITAGVPVQVDIDYHLYYPEDAPLNLQGVLLVGPPAAPGVLEIPIHLTPDILLYPAPKITIASRWIAQAPVPVTLTFQNIGVTAEAVDVQVILPEGLVYQSGSAGWSGPLNRTLTWNGTAVRNAPVSLSFLVTAETGYPPGEAKITATVEGLTSGQRWEVGTLVELNRFGIFMPLLRR
jgi:subtilisin family serine protease